MTELSPYCIWSKIVGNLWVKRTTELSECLDGILLSDFEHDTWSRGHVLNHSHELWEDSLVYLEELFCGGLIQSEHLKCRNLKTLLEYHIDDLPSKTVCDDMWLDNAACAIIEGSGSSEVFIEVHGDLSVVVGGRSTGVNCVSHAVGSEMTSQRVSWSSLGVSWPKKVSEALHRILVYELHAGDNVTLHES